MDYDFENMSNESLKALERLAWKEQLDFSEFPAPEYKFFDTIQALGIKCRNEGIPPGLLEKDIAKARRIYRSESMDYRHSKWIYGKYQDAILLSDNLRCQMTKEDDPGKVLHMALYAVELLTGDTTVGKTVLENLGCDVYEYQKFTGTIGNG